MTQPPPPMNSATESFLEYANRPDGIREIAVRQRAIMICILVYILLIVAQFVLPPALRLWLAVPALAVVITATVFVFLLATKMYGTALGVVGGILVLVPCLGLLVLLAINQKATSTLRARGLKVGLLGAKVPD